MPAKYAQDLKKTYAQIALEYEKKHFNDVDNNGMEIFLNLLPNNAKVLDLGAGNGRDSKWFVEHGCEVTMSDLSTEMLKIASAKVPEARVIQGDMTEMDLDSNSYDGVWARASLLHVTKEEGQVVTKKVFEILKNDGVFFCTVKEGEGEQEVTDNKYGQETTRFFSFYTRSEAEEMLKKVGFKEIKSYSNVSRSGMPWVQVMGIKKINKK